MSAFVDNETVRNNVQTIHSQLEGVSDIEYHSILNGLGWKRPWRWVPAFWSKENWLFQLFHVMYVVLVFCIPCAWPDKWWSWLVGALVFAAGREYEQWKNWDWKVFMWRDRVLDIVGHLVGSQILFWGIRWLFS